MEWGAAISAIFALLLWGLKTWSEGKPGREQEQRHDEIQQGRADIAAGDADAVSGRIDRLLADGQPLSDGQQGNQVTAERINSISRVADTGRSIGKDSGSR